MAENSQAVIPDNLIIVDGEIGLPSSSASDAGKILAVDAEGSPEWVTPSGGTQYSEGTGIDISDQNVISIDTSVVATQNDLSGLQGALTAGTGIDITSDTISVDTSVIATQNDLSGLQPALTAGDNISISNNTISATDTTYTAGSGLSLTGTEFAIDTTVVATQTDLSGIDDVPEVTSSDDGKVLTAAYSGGTGSYSWVTPSGGTSYTAGTGIDITGDAISVDTTVVATQTDLTGIEQVPTVTSNDDGKVLTATYSGGTGSFAWATPSGGTSYTAGTGIDITSGTISVDTTVVATQTDLGNVRQVPSAQSADNGKVLGVTDTSGTLGWVSQPADELPSISGNSGKVLKVNAGGTAVEWATESAGTTYTAGNMISLANDAVAVSTTAGITDIQLVNALPASPVATVLYLIPET